MSPNSRTPSGSAPAFVLASALLLVNPRSSRAESNVAYKYEDYQESAGRVGVQAQYALLEQSLGTDAKLKLTGVIDAIAGATPTGQAPATLGGDVPLTEMHDRRKAWTADYSQQAGRINFGVGIANSRESDYVSNGATLNTLTDFNDKNTTLLLGINVTSDRVRVFYQPDYADKHGVDLVIGVNQLLGPKTSVAVNVSFGRSRGYLGDPYRIISKTTEIVPGIFLPLTFAENRPDRRDKWVVFAGVNQAVDHLNGALEGSARLYRDTFGTRSYTLEATWLQRIGTKVVLIPSVRYYWQSAADFYYVSLDGTNITPGDSPNSAGPFFSADYRLSNLRSLTYGLKAVWNATDRLHFDLAWDRYTMTGLDNVTSASAYPRARMITAGAGYTW